MSYNKLIFVCKENVYLSPMAEWVMKSIIMDKTKKIFSRGLVVLFPEPRNMKVTDVLMNHAIPCEEQVSQEFDISEVDHETLVVAMNFTEKVKLVEEFGLTENVVTLMEFLEEEEEDLMDPYDKFYVELKELLYRIKKKLDWR